MDSDIDIEEHNLLDNPALRAIFPDITVLKQEIFEINNEDDQNFQDENPNIGVEGCALYSNESNNLASKSLKLPDKICSVVPKTFGFVNKNIPHTISSQTENNNNFTTKNIIDSTKKHTFDNHCLRNDNYLTRAKVVLSDVTPMLKRCEKFCNICSILFPNKNTLQKHTHRSHSEICTCKQCKKNLNKTSNFSDHRKNIYRGIIEHRNGSTITKKTIKRNNRVIKTSKKNKAELISCFHCQKIFSSKQLLIQHLYFTLEPQFIENLNRDRTKKDSNKNLDVEPPRVSELPAIPNKQQENLVVNSIPKQTTDKHVMKNIKENTLVQKSKRKETSLFFKCFVCLRYFKECARYKYHIKWEHKIKTKFSLKMVEFNPKCDLCSRLCRNVKLYNIHIGNHMNTSVVERRNLKRKLKINMLTNKKRSNIIIPKDIVFKCGECNFYFISPTLATNHTQHCEITILWKCRKCQFIFKRNEAYSHIKQHAQTEKFNVVNVSHKTSPELLYCCPKCKICFQERKIKEHYLTCKTTENSVHCKICDIYIDQELKESHAYLHDKGRKNSTDFLIVQLTQTLKEKQSSTCGKLNGDIFVQNLHLYFCKTCQNFVSTVHKVSIHQKARCTHMLRMPCRYCGLPFTNKAIMTHRSMHYNDRTLKLQDFTFYDLDSNKEICPPIIEFIKCDSCNVHYFNQVALKSHICGEEIVLVCPYCDIKCSEFVYKLHLPFHTYKLHNKTGDTHISEYNTECGIKQQNIKLITNIRTDSVKKGNQFKIFSEDIKYCCKMCLIYVNTYDNVIKHCQSHLTSDSTVQATSAIQVPDTSQKIFYFEPKHYGSNNQFWLQHIFNGLPMADIDKILSNAIYKYESRIKLQVSKNGIPEYTEYQCETCHCFVDCLSLFKHINACTRKIKKYSCKFCARRFDSEDASTKHLKLHESSLDPETCRIVSFNRKIDKKINDLIKANPSRPYVVYQCRNCEGLINRSNFSSHICTYTDLENCNVCGLLLYKSHFADHLRKHKELQSFTVNNMKVVLLGLRTPSTNKTKVSSFMGIVCDYIFYRCSKCNVCIKEFRCIAKHFCLIETCKAQCHKCDLYFDEGKLKGHIKLHADDLDFVKDNITLIDFNPKENTNEDDVVTLPKMSNEQSTLVDGDDVEIVDDKAIQTVEEKTATLYKCAKCKLHFLNKNSVDDHIRKKPARITKQFCTKCGFSFSPNTLFHHLLEHHGQRDIKYTFQVEDVFGTFKKQKVYKCIKCNLHFTNLKKANEHHSKCSGDSSQGEKCKCCGLMFHFSYLLNHERNSENNSHTDYEVVEAEGE